MRHRIAQRGATLIELTVAIVVVAVAVGGVLSGLAAMSMRSAETLIRAQAVAIASAYLDEILAKAWVDPDGVEGEGRAAYDDILDYNGLANTGTIDQLGNAIAGHGQFRISVAVGPGSLGSVPVAEVRRVDVTVRHSTGYTVLLSGYRTRQP